LRENSLENFPYYEQGNKSGEQSTLPYKKFCKKYLRISKNSKQCLLWRKDSWLSNEYKFSQIKQFLTISILQWRFLNHYFIKIYGEFFVKNNKIAIFYPWNLRNSPILLMHIYNALCHNLPHIFGGESVPPISREIWYFKGNFENFPIFLFIREFPLKRVNSPEKFSGEFHKGIHSILFIRALVTHALRYV